MSTSFMDQANRTPGTYLVLIAYATFGVVTGVMEPDYDKLHKFGAAAGHAVANGEPWRLVAHAFLHGGLIHLLFNLYGLVFLGPMLEERIGTGRFAVLYGVTAICGGVTANLWNMPNVPLVGGSGALFGMMGSILALEMRQGRYILDFMNFVGPRQLVILIIANLVIGMLIPVVSNAAHLGGLIGGFALTFCFFARRREPADRTSRVIQAAWVAVFVAITAYCTRPVVRSDFLLNEILARQADAPSERRTQLAHAIMESDPGMTFLGSLRTEDRPKFIVMLEHFAAGN